MLGDRQPAALGGVGFGAVGVEPLQVVVHHLGQLRVRAGGGDLGQRRVDRRPGRRPARRRRPGAPARVTGAITATCSAVTRPSANAAATAGRCSSARPVRDQPVRGGRDSRPCPRSQDCMRLQPVVLGGLGELGLADACGPAGRPAGSAAPSSRRVRSSTCGPNRRRQVLGGEPVQRGLEVRERVTRTVRTHVRRIAVPGAAAPESPGQRPVHRCADLSTPGFRNRQPPATDGSTCTSAPSRTASRPAREADVVAVDVDVHEPPHLTGLVADPPAPASGARRPGRRAGRRGCRRAGSTARASRRRPARRARPGSSTCTVTAASPP